MHLMATMLHCKAVHDGMRWHACAEVTAKRMIGSSLERHIRLYVSKPMQRRC